MKIGKIKQKLNDVDGDISIEFDFCRFAPTTINSYRGYYNQPAIGWGDRCNGKVKDFLDQLNECTSGKVYQGYKGGDYTYDDDDELYVANWGHSHDVIISHISISDYEVILHTEKLISHY